MVKRRTNSERLFASDLNTPTLAPAHPSPSPEKKKVSYLVWYLP